MQRDATLRRVKGKELFKQLKSAIFCWDRGCLLSQGKPDERRLYNDACNRVDELENIVEKYKRTYSSGRSDLGRHSSEHGRHITIGSCVLKLFTNSKNRDIMTREQLKLSILNVFHI